mgnify:FL=1
MACVVLVAAVVGFAAHRWFDIVLLYGFLLGATGGLTAWMVLDEFDPKLQGTRAIAVAGVGAAAVICLLSGYFRYRFDVAGMDARPGWGRYLSDTAGAGAAFGRRGWSSTIDLGAPFVWGARVTELTVAMLVGGGVARTVDLRR